MSHEDDPDPGWNDGGMFGPHLEFNSPEEEMEFLRGLHESQKREIEEADVNKALGWNMRHGNKEQEKMMTEMRQTDGCVEIPSPDYRNRPKTDMNPYSMSHSSKEIFVLVNKAVGILDEAFSGIPEEDKETLRKMVVKGKDHVDPEGEMFMAVYGKVKSLLVHIGREITEGRPVQTFEIWREGFEDEDGKEKAVLLAKGIPGSDFADAVEFWYSSTVDAEHIYGPLVKKGEKEKAKMWLWGCRLYDNEQDAKRRFG